MSDSIQPAAWDALVNQVSPQRPSIGKTVKVTQGKHTGRTGKVFWHGVDKYDSSWRYCTPHQHWLREAVGRHGYRIGIVTDTGEKFFVAADKVVVTHDAEGRPVEIPNV